MPKKPRHPCGYPGCAALVESGCRYCKEHQKLVNKNYEKYERDPQTKKRYGCAWKRIRDGYAAAHPLCEQCLKEGRYTKTEEIHHVKPLSEGGTHERSNLMALCKPCHARIHAERGDRWNKRTATYEK